jgi:hypothetical protein
MGHCPAYMIPSHTLPLEALGRLAAPRTTPPGRESYPQGPNCLREAKVVEFVAQIGSLGVSAMSDRGSGAGQTVVPLATQSNARSEAGGDPLDAAGKAILGSLHRAASAAEANYQQALEMTDKLSAGLRAAEDRMRELEAKVRHHQDRADRAEKWLYQVSVEIEQKFFGREEARSSQPPPPQALLPNQRQ